jgi:hypothetical protein
MAVRSEGLEFIVHAPGMRRIVAQRPIVGKIIVIVIGVSDPGQGQLFHVADALSDAGLFRTAGKDGQQQGGEDCNDGDNDKEFD